jgi:hypothetical protein
MYICKKLRPGEYSERRIKVIIEIIFVAFFILLGIIFSLGKGSFLIAGFNTMPKKDQEKYDAVSLCKFIGKVMFIIAFSILLFILSDVLKLKILYYIGIILIWATPIFAIFYVNIGNKFKNTND